MEKESEKFNGNIIIVLGIHNDCYDLFGFLEPFCSLLLKDQKSFVVPIECDGNEDLSYLDIRKINFLYGINSLNLNPEDFKNINLNFLDNKENEKKMSDFIDKLEEENLIRPIDNTKFGFYQRNRKMFYEISDLIEKDKFKNVVFPVGLLHGVQEGNLNLGEKSLYRLLYEKYGDNIKMICPVRFSSTEEGLKTNKYNPEFLPSMFSADTMLNCVKLKPELFYSFGDVSYEDSCLKFMKNLISAKINTPNPDELLKFYEKSKNEEENKKYEGLSELFNLSDNSNPSINKI